MLSSLLYMTDSLFTGWVGGFNLTLIEFPERFVAAMLKILLKPFAYMPREISGKSSLPSQFLKGQCATKFSCSAIVRYRTFVINQYIYFL